MVSYLAPRGVKRSLKLFYERSSLCIWFFSYEWASFEHLRWNHAISRLQAFRLVAKRRISVLQRAFTFCLDYTKKTRQKACFGCITEFAKSTKFLQPLNYFPFCFSCTLFDQIVLHWFDGSFSVTLAFSWEYMVHRSRKADLYFQFVRLRRR